MLIWVLIIVHTFFSIMNGVVSFQGIIAVAQSSPAVFCAPAILYFCQHVQDERFQALIECASYFIWHS